MSKCGLYKLLAGAAVWFYPSTYSETFCITAIENMYCGNAVVMPPRYGTTEYAGLIEPMSRQFATDDRINFMSSMTYSGIDPDNYRKACEEAASKIVRYISDFNDPAVRTMRGKAHDFIAKEFSWSAVVAKWEALFSSHS